MTLQQRFGLAVARRRRQLKLSQDELGEQAGLHRTFIGRVERGETNVTLDTAQKISDALGSSLKDLVAEAERKK